MEAKKPTTPLFLAHFKIDHKKHWPKQFRKDFSELALQGYIKNIRENVIVGYALVRGGVKDSFLRGSRSRTLLDWFNKRLRAKPLIIDHQLLLVKCYEADYREPAIVRYIEDLGGKISTEIGHIAEEDGVETINCLFRSRELFGKTHKALKIFYRNMLVDDPILHDSPGLCRCDPPLFLESLVGEKLPQHRTHIDEYLRGKDKEKNSERWLRRLVRRLQKKKAGEKVLDFLLRRFF